MAMTMSDNMSASNDWFQFYQQQQDFHGVPSSTISADATAVTTVVSTAGVTASSPPLLPGMLNSTSSASTSTHHLSPEGRVAKPVRRRSRASRRTPTTLLNTDTTNFRAMVQQFTGGPSAPYAPTPSSTASSGLASLGFGFGPRHAHIGPTGGLMVGPPAGYHLQQHQQQPQLFQQQNLAFHGSNPEAGDQSRFLQRLNSSSNNNNNPRASNNATDLGIGGFVMDHGSLGRFFPSTS
ncbi:VQ motif-containing protein 22-like [Neltuma alba]|uniref:VQ motif-containing protein 22-like n=1 Tax=Neltuma alba TaxID=207710 RepID=UPI0010A46954|nr:VQ motif-containing protein 22-like [Prosopis alba]